MSDSASSTPSGARQSGTPWLPSGRELALASRGTTFVREIGAAHAPTLVLLHGWTVTADLNWFRCYRPLGRRYRVIAPDIRGHGRGVRSWRPFRLEEAADDIATLIETLAPSNPVVVVGYSMGGSVAQLLWRRHPEAVDALVLCATAARFTNGDLADRAVLAGIFGASVASRVAPVQVRRVVADGFIRRRLAGQPMADWAARELGRSDPTSVIEAGGALRTFDSTRWAASIDVPTAVVVPTRDGVVSPYRQRELAETIPGATLHRVEGDHGVCVNDAARFVPVLQGALADVTARLPQLTHAAAR